MQLCDLTGVRGGVNIFHGNPNLAGQLTLSRPHQALCKLLKVGPALAWDEEQQLLATALGGEGGVGQLLKLVRGQHVLCSEDGDDAVHV